MAIKDIAKLVGVSPATVSRVLNNPEYHCKNPDMTERIWNAAMELNYVPNEAARNLKKRDPSVIKNIAYHVQVLVIHSEKSQTDPFLTELLRVVESECHNNGCILSHVWYMPILSDNKKCGSDHLKHIVSELYDATQGKSNGLIVIGRCNKEALKILETYFKNVVSINRNATNYQVDEVICDGRKIAALALEYLHQLGHKEIGYVGNIKGEERYQGYIDFLNRHDRKRNEYYIWETSQSEAAGFRIMEEILEQSDIPTAIYCANDITAVGMLKALGKTKNKYFTLSLVSSDGIELAQDTTPMLTTVELPKSEMGKFAVSLLLDRIRGGHRSVATIELGGQLVRRESCVNVEDSRYCDYYI